MKTLLDFYEGHTHKLAIALAHAQKHGILVDKERVAQYKKEATTRLAKHQAVICQEAGDKFNPNSPKQVKELLYDKLKFPVIWETDSKTRLKKISTAEIALKKLQKRYPSESILEALIMQRKESKLISTYLDMKIDDDGRLRCSWNASGTKGARISSSQTIFKTGLDLQNIPAGRSKGVQNIKDVFIAGNGKKLVKMDLSQAEARDVAHILRRIGDPTLFNLYQDKTFDIHKWMATFIYKKNIEDIIKSERQVGKLANHSGNYMAGPRVLVNKALKDEMSIDYNFAQSILDARSKAMPGLQVWWDWVAEQIRMTRTLVTPFGRRRIFFGRLNAATFRDAVSYEPQSTIGDLCNWIFWNCFYSLVENEPDCVPVLQVHDEVVIECPEAKVEFIIKVVQKCSNVLLWICEDVPLYVPQDISVGDNWKDCKEI